MTRKERRELEQKEKNRSRKRMLTILEIIFLIILIISLVKIVTWQIENNKSKKLLDTISENIKVIKNEETGKIEEYKIDINKLKELNDETVGYIAVEGTKISYPIVKANDNDFYLTHSFDKTNNSSGWIFMNYKNSETNLDQNTIIFGHNRRNDDMFGTLKDVLTSKWQDENNLKENQEFVHYVNMNNKNYKCKVFSIYEIPNEEYYLQNKFDSDEEYEKFLSTITQRSSFDFNVKPTVENKIITLSTCGNDSKKRVVLHAIIE